MKDAKPHPVKASGAGRSGGLNAEIQSRIGHQLRAMYEDVVRQGVPDRFAELIKQLDGDKAGTLDGSESSSGPSGGRG